MLRSLAFSPSTFVRTACTLSRLRRLGGLGLGLAAMLGASACASLEPDPAAERSATAPTPPSLWLGADTTCAVVLGAGKCWGAAADGRLGAGVLLGSAQSEPSALDWIDLGGPVLSMATNGAQTYALLADGSVRAFGLNDAGQLGLGHTETIGDDETPAQASVTSLVPLGGVADAVVAGRDFACAHLVDGRVQCWGSGDDGQLGRGPQPGTQSPADVQLGAAAVDVIAGAGHACAVLEGGAVRCWGRNDAGQLGYGPTSHSTQTPAVAGDVPLPSPAVELVAGGDHTCARFSSGAIHCWGDNSDGQLGLGHTETIGDDEPASAGAAAVLGAPAVSMTAGRRHTCALMADDTVRCWGASSNGQLGTIRTAIGDDELPTSVAPVDLGEGSAIAVYSGALADHTCVVRGDLSTRCWGLNDYGQLGLGFVDPQDPVEGPPGELPDVIIVDDSEL